MAASILLCCSTRNSSEPNSHGLHGVGEPRERLISLASVRLNMNSDGLI